MPRYAEHELLSTRIGGMLQLGKNASCYTNGNQDDAVKATATLTAAGSLSNNDTVTIAGRTYTFKTSLTASTTANEVLIGANAAASLDNIKSAVNGSAGGGTTYGSETTAHTTVTATTNTDTTQVFEAITAGTVGNAYASTETGSNLSFGGATFSGGTDKTVSDIQTNIRANTPYPAYEVLQERVAKALGYAKNIGDVTTATLSADDTVAEVIARCNVVESGSTNLL